MLHSWSPVVMFDHLSSSSTSSVGILASLIAEFNSCLVLSFIFFLLHVIFYIGKVVYFTTCWIGRRDCSTFLKCLSHILFTSRAFRWFWQSFRLFGYLTSRCAPDHSQWYCFLARWRNICDNFSDFGLDVNYWLQSFDMWVEMEHRCLQCFWAVRSFMIYSGCLCHPSSSRRVSWLWYVLWLVLLSHFIFSVQ